MFHKFVTQIRDQRRVVPGARAMSLQQIVAVGDQFDYRSAGTKTVLGGGSPSCFRVVASSCHVSPRAASRSLMWSSARFRRSANVLGLSSVDIQKSLKKCRTISRRRSISCLLGEASGLMLIWLSGRTATISTPGAKSSAAILFVVSLDRFG